MESNIEIRNWTLSKRKVGHGHYKVSIDIDVNGHLFRAEKVITDMTIIDDWADVENQQMLIDRLMDDNKDAIDEFVAVVHAQKSL